MTIIKLLCFVISAWWLIAVVADLLYVILTHDPTAVSTFICNPFCIISFPMTELKMHKGALVWGFGLLIFVLTLIFFL